MIYIRYNCAEFHLCRMCVTDFREESLSVSNPKKAHLNRVKKMTFLNEKGKAT